MEIRRVRCPVPRCGALFPVAPERLGRRTFCPQCGERMTARPHEVDGRLQEQERRIDGSAGERHIARLPFRVVLDNVRSMWNVGSMFRTADAFGVQRMTLAGITACPPRPEISKTALGAERAVAWDYVADPRSALQDHRAAGFTIVALESGPQATPLDRFVWPKRCCLVVGNEVAGVSLPLLEASDLCVSIPMHGVKDSLNVAVAFGIAAQAAVTAIRGATDETDDGAKDRLTECMR